MKPTTSWMLVVMVSGNGKSAGVDGEGVVLSGECRCSVGYGVLGIGCGELGVVRACVMCVTCVHVQYVQKSHTARCRASHGLVECRNASVLDPLIRALVTSPSQHSFRHVNLRVYKYKESENAGRTWWCRRPCARDQHLDDEDDRAANAKPYIMNANVSNALMNESIAKD